jgi:hypothetical protein
MEHNIEEPHDELAQLESMQASSSFMQPEPLPQHETSFSGMPEEPIMDYGQAEMDPDAVECSLQDLQPADDYTA